MNKITTHLWYDKEAKEAAEFYASVFPNSRIKDISTIDDTPSGSVDMVSMEICNQPFSLISAGPYFKFNPSISFLVACDSKEEVDKIWKPLSTGGMSLMELGEYPFSEWYGWTQDKYGLSWQIMYMGDRKMSRKITPTLMFVDKQNGRAEEAIGFYTKIFRNSSRGNIHRYEKGDDPDQVGMVKHGTFTLDDHEFAIMDGGRIHEFRFNEAISFMVHCQDQTEIDYYWEKLSAIPEAEQCGWLKDKYGLSWQIIPIDLERMLRTGDPDKTARVTAAFLKMKKFDLAELNQAFTGAV